MIVGRQRHYSRDITSGHGGRQHLIDRPYHGRNPLTRLTKREVDNMPFRAQDEFDAATAIPSQAQASPARAAATRRIRRIGNMTISLDS